MGLGSGIRDPGSGKNLFRSPDPGVKKAPDPQHCLQQIDTIFCAKSLKEIDSASSAKQDHVKFIQVINLNVYSCILKGTF
jgi:hypothetical protein